MSWQEEKNRLGQEIIRGLYEKGMILTWYRDKPEGWKLVSGLWSPFYIQLRPTSSHPDLYKQIGQAISGILENEAGYKSDGHRVVGIAMAGIPIANAVTLSSGIPSLWTRKLEGVNKVEDLEMYIKHHGQHALVEGEMEDGDRLALVDDLVTKFDSKLLAKRQVEYEARNRGINVTCDDVVVLFDREQGAYERAEEVGMKLHALIPFASKGLGWLEEVLHPDEHGTITDYLRDAEPYQDPGRQRELREMVPK